MNPIKKHPYEVLYEDDAIMVVNKPSGLLVIPAPTQHGPTLTDLVNRDLDQRHIEINAYPCHRLDRDTSGVILYAKGKAMQQQMMDAFKKRMVKKRYYAAVLGRILQKNGTIKKPVYNVNKHRQDEAITKYAVITANPVCSFVEVTPITGRRNQIRIHFKEIGHPIFGERVYAFRKDFPIPFKRVALHAYSLSFKHPLTGKEISFSAPLPLDIRQFLQKQGLLKGGPYALR